MSAAIPPPGSSGYTATTSVPLYWAAYGPSGAPGLLVLHGGPGAHHDYLLPQMLDLADQYELLFYDQRGGGRSKTADVAPIGWRTHVDDLALVVRELGVGAPSLLGYSWGGLLALLYAIEAGAESVAGPPPKRMVLIDPAPLTREFRRQFEEEFSRRQNSAELRQLRAELMASGLRERDPDVHRQRLFELGVAGYFADPHKARGLTPFRVTGRVQESVWASLGEFDVVSRAGSVGCPTLILHGTEDPIPVASSEAVASAMPHARLVTLAHSGHVPYIEAGEALFRAIRQFLVDTDKADDNASLR